MMKQKTEKRGVDKSVLTIAVVVLAALVILLLQHMILSHMAAARAEKEYQRGLDEAKATVETVEVSPEITLEAATLRELVAATGKLTAYEYFYTDVGTYEKSQKLFNTDIALPFTTDKTLYTYSGKIGAGIELGQIVFEVDNDKKTITATFPEPKILFHEMGKEFEFYDVMKAAFSQSNFNDFEEFRGALMEKQEEKLKNNQDFWESVKENSETVVKGLVTASGQIDDYTIICKW